MRADLARHAALIALILMGTSLDASAETRIDCEVASEASAYAADFGSQLTAATARVKLSEAARQRRFEVQRDRIVKAGLWSEQDGNRFVFDFASNNPASLELEARRLQAAKELKTLYYTIAGLAVVAASDRQAEHRGMCIFGQKVMLQLSTMDEASDAAWTLVDTRVAQFAREKAVPGF